MRSPFLFSIALIIASAVCSISFAAPIKIVVVSGLEFGNGGPGDVAKTVSPGTSETSTNASFRVNGDANRAYTITLPATGSMTTGNGPTADSITLNNFLSFPVQGANGLLSVAGSQNLFVGATRAALKINQRAGTYNGSYSIAVVY